VQGLGDSDRLRLIPGDPVEALKKEKGERPLILPVID